MKKFLVLLFAVAFVLTLSACGNTTYELALVTDIGTIDDGSFNQGAWEGMKAYADDNDLTYKYYQPATATTDDRVATIELAIENGATTVVTPGYMFENVIWQVQTDHPDVKFIFLDGSPSNVVTYDDASTTDVDETVLLEGSTTADFTIADNTLSIFYQEDQSGFLAGYAAVKDGNTELGFVGGIAVPAVIRFGYGYIQGAAYAAEEDNVEVTINYWYSNVFWEDSNVQSKAVSWYTDGTTVIFAAAGGAGGSVMTAAEQEDGLVIGVDVDQAAASTTVITSAKKELANSVYQALESIYDGTFEGGKAITLGVTEDGVGLPQDFSRFTSFDQAAYDAIYALLVAGTVTVSSDTSVTPTSFDNDYVTVNLVE
ncbi:MAG: BMP family ABC transporter substrate-binding protein [Bacilli bacterium]|nr:BMP family ABC transporter substrate-binding protein [Bacilli bacterium]